MEAAVIVVTTPTGQIGRRVLDHILDRDERVRVVARDPARLDARVRDRVEIVQGSTDDADIVTKACAGADVLFLVVPPDPRADSLQRHVVRFALPACEAITRQDVDRVVAVSSLGRGKATSAGQVSAIFAMDALIESTGVHYRSLQPPGFMDNMLRQVASIKGNGTFYATLPADRALPACAARDIAATAAGLLLDSTWSGQEGVPLPGPEVLSNEDMARIMSDVLRRPVHYERISGEAQTAVLVGHGVTDAWAQGLVDMSSAADRGMYDDAPRSPDWPTPTSFRQWCEEVLAPAVAAA